MTPQDASSAVAPMKLGILLIDGFTLLSYASIIEPLRAANMFAGANLYRWTHISADGGTVPATSGALINADAAVGDFPELDMLFIVAGGALPALEDLRLLSWVRHLAHKGTTIAGIAGGPYLMAKAGLLDGHRCTVHWDLVPLFLETFPALSLEDRLYVMDRKRLTCAGGTAGLDLIFEIIERHHGRDLSVRVSQWMLCTQQRPTEEVQRVSLRERYNTRNDRLLKVLACMESNIEEPRDRSYLAKAAGVSQRQLSRLFKSHLKSTIEETYRHIRLDYANALLRRTAMPVTEVAIASGFSSSSHFSRTFKARYGYPPRASRS